MDIRQYKSGDETRILELFKLVFKQEMTLEYWNWRFKNNPFTSEVFISLMWEGEELIGHYAVSPIEMYCEGSLISTALSMTTMTHPDHGGKGIFSQLATHLYGILQKKAYKMIWGFPNNNSHYGFVKNLHWKDVAIIPMMFLERTDFKLDHDLAEKYQISNFFNPDIVNDIENLEKSVRINKTKEFLQWRYLDNPSNDYKILNLKNNSGVVVYKIFPSFEIKDKWEIDIMEINFSRDIGFLKNLISSILKEESSTEIEKFNLWYSLFNEDRILLEKTGFKIGVPLTYLGNLNLSKSNSLSNYEKWEIGLGYSDVF